MTTIHELRGLLDRALQSTEVRPRGNLPTRYSLESYAQALRGIRQRYAPDLRLALKQCDIEIRDRTAREHLDSVLGTALQHYIHEGRIQTAIINIYGGLGSGFEIESVRKKLLELAVALGSEEAAARFIESLSESKCEFQFMTLLGGAKVEIPVELYDGVRIISLSQNDTDLPGFLPNVFQQEGLERFRGGTVLVEDGWVSPRYMNPEEYLEVADLRGNTPFQMGRKSTVTFDFNASEFCNALSVAAKTRVFPSASWRSVSENEIANLWGAGSGYSWVRDPDSDRRTSVTDDQLQDAKGLYESLTRMNSGERTRLAIPIDRLIASWGAKAHVDQIIDLAIALESLYLPEFDSELSYRLRNRGARYLEASLTERQALARQLRVFYEVRSKAIHTGRIPETHRVGSREVKTTEFVGIIQDLCVRSIRQVIDSGFPDWEAIELG